VRRVLKRNSGARWLISVALDKRSNGWAQKKKQNAGNSSIAAEGDLQEKVAPH
jgi:hypothetical protein